VKAAFGTPGNVKQWRALYGALPHDTFDIIADWLNDQLEAGSAQSLEAASTFIFAARASVDSAPVIAEWNAITFACWLQCEKMKTVRLVPLFYSIGRQQYERLAAVLPRALPWHAYPQTQQLMDRLQLPRFTLKWTVPRQILIGLLERIEWHTTLLAPLMRHLPRGRMDLFSLALGHISRSYTTWPYMACLIKEAPDGAQLALPRDQQRKRARISQESEAEVSED
jgi:hypothetical protein